MPIALISIWYTRLTINILYQQNSFRDNYCTHSDPVCITAIQHPINLDFAWRNARFTCTLKPKYIAADQSILLSSIGSWAMSWFIVIYFGLSHWEISHFSLLLTRPPTIPILMSVIRDSFSILIQITLPQPFPAPLVDIQCQTSCACHSWHGLYLFYYIINNSDSGGGVFFHCEPGHSSEDPSSKTPSAFQSMFLSTWNTPLYIGDRKTELAIISSWYNQTPVSLE